jgi:hypothetical protein
VVVGNFSNLRNMIDLGSKPYTPGAPPTPTNARGSSSGLTLTVSWDAVAGASYILEAGSGPGLSNLYNGSVGTSTSITAPVPAGTYYLRVRATNAFGTSAPSSEVVINVGTSGTPSPGCLAPPSGLTLSVTGNILTIQWSAVAGATGYALEVGSGPSLANVLTANLGAVTSQQFNIAGAPGALYYLRVRAQGACGTSAASNDALLDLR